MFTSSENKILRRTGQFLIPAVKENPPEGKYDIYPSFRIADNLIYPGFESLAEKISGHKLIIIDGYIGIFFDIFQERIDSILRKKSFTTNWIITTEYLRPEAEILKMTAPYTGGDDPLFGTKTTLELEDFFIPGTIGSLQPDNLKDINILIGPGASLASWNG
ncbi:MAG: hypothetical protein Q8868_01095, partial [Bacteroidota bacterium]|nr:hypothetical protein [Bacteroidota bacterium]